MKSDIDIQDDIFRYLRDNNDFWLDMSEVWFTPSCLVHDSHAESKEQIVISVLSNGGDVEEVQEAFVNVNVFVKDIADKETTKRAGKVAIYYPDRKRLRRICSIMAKHLSSYGDTYRFGMEEQRVFADKETNTHFVNNKVLYHSINL